MKVEISRLSRGIGGYKIYYQVAISFWPLKTTTTTIHWKERKKYSQKKNSFNKTQSLNILAMFAIYV